MIPNVVTGGHMYGLLRYLQGPGRGDEHENPHVVGGDHFVQSWFGAETLETASVSELSDYLEKPRRQYGTTVKAQITEQDPATGAKQVTGYKPAHVWHCSLSLRSEEGPLSDEQWEQVAADFMDGMEFTEASGKSPARWVAIHHGASKNGNDHIHIAASRVREDGTRWSDSFSKQRSQDVCRELEVKHGLEAVAGPVRGVCELGEQPGQRVAAQKAGLSTTAPKELGHRVRASMVASTSEAEWIRRCRADGVVLKPFFAKGTTDVVTGYRAALKPEQYGDRLAFYKGGSLGRDLTLPRVRESWEQPSAEQAGEASAEWQAAFKGQPPVVEQGRERVRFDQLAPGAQDVASANWAAYNDRLAQIPLTDTAAWSDAARDGAGVLSAWAKADPENREELRAAAATMARSAQLRRAPRTPREPAKESPMGTALILMAAAHPDRKRIQGAMLMRQVLRTATALRDAHAAAGALREARQVQTQVVERLERVRLVGYKATMPEGLGKAEQDAWRGQQALKAIAPPERGVSPRPPREAGLSDPLPNPLADPLADPLAPVRGVPAGTDPSRRGPSHGGPGRGQGEDHGHER